MTVQNVQTVAKRYKAFDIILFIFFSIALSISRGINMTYVESAVSKNCHGWDVKTLLRQLVHILELNEGCILED